MKLNKKIITRSLISDTNDDGFVDADMATRISMVWEITKDAWAFVRGSDAEQRLQRDVTMLIKRKR